jgi:hypothetical protein
MARFWVFDGMLAMPPELVKRVLLNITASRPEEFPPAARDFRLMVGIIILLAAAEKIKLRLVSIFSLLISGQTDLMLRLMVEHSQLGLRKWNLRRCLLESSSNLLSYKWPVVVCRQVGMALLSDQKQVGNLRQGLVEL